MNHSLDNKKPLQYIKQYFNNIKRDYINLYNAHIVDDYKVSTKLPNYSTMFEKMCSAHPDVASTIDNGLIMYLTEKMEWHVSSEYTWFRDDMPSKERDLFQLLIQNMWYAYNAFHEKSRGGQMAAGKEIQIYDIAPSDRYTYTTIVVRNFEKLPDLKEVYFFPAAKPNYGFKIPEIPIPFELDRQYPDSAIGSSMVIWKDGSAFPEEVKRRFKQLNK